MPGTLQPLDQKFAIVDDQGRPTLYFTQWAQQKQIDITGSAQIDGGNDFTGDQNIDGNLTVTDGGLTLKAVSTSLGFTIADRSTSPGHQINFSSNAPVTAGGAVLNVFAAQSSATKKNLSQISLWTVPPTAVSAVQSAIRASAGASGEEMIFLTQQFGTGVLTAGDIVFKPNNVEKLRILSAAGDPAVKVTGQLSVTDDPYSASWDGSTDVPTKNAVYDKINSLPSGGGGALVLLEQHTAATSASLNFTAAINATYDEYLIEFVNVVPATNAVSLYMRMSTNGGTSYDAGANYSYNVSGLNRFGLGQTGVDSGGTQILLTKSTVDNTVTNGISGSIRLFSPLSATLHKNVTGQLNILTGGVIETQQASGWYRSVTAVNAFQFLMSAGNIASGTIRVYGVAK